ncbi:MAG: DUF4911 domain-containing protein [Deltaproteobacteria bacterium HGW-Deltaproteobacteria-10]|nr:MAG: DUF4911 domain-containing protein [Deltaproteobacteria bacterium HGW-Deltaproteobacteria-10]
MIKKRFKLKRSDIAIVQFIVEGYEGMATVTTLDPHTAVIQIAIMPDYVEEMINLLDNLKNKFHLEDVEYYTASI